MVRRAAAEAIGAAFLLAAVVGSGIMGERLAEGNIAIALLANTMATGAMLVALTNPHVRADFGGAPQSSREAGGCFARRLGLA